MLSRHEQRRLVEIERELSQDATLARLADQFAHRGPRGHRIGWRILWLFTALIPLGGFALVVIGVWVGSVGDILVGMLLTVLLGVPLVIIAVMVWLNRRALRPH